MGVLGFETLRRERGKRRPKHGRPAEERESSRWLKLVDRVEKSIADRFTAVHVMDREADAYEILAGLESARSCRRCTVQGNQAGTALDSPAVHHQ